MDGGESDCRYLMMRVDANLGDCDVRMPQDTYGDGRLWCLRLDVKRNDYRLGGAVIGIWFVKRAR